MLVSSDPVISSLRTHTIQADKKIFHKDAIPMFEEPPILAMPAPITE